MAEVRYVQAEWAKRLNELEEHADDNRFEQAAEVVRLRDAGKEQQEIAANWLKRNGEPYTRQYVSYAEKIGRRNHDCVTWADAWNWAIGRAHVSANSGDNEWYTPPEYIQAAREVMGGIDLDPASSAEANDVVGAALWWAEPDNPLEEAWRGRVWMNPPYARPLIDAFCGKLAEEYSAGNVTQAITLTNNATETGWFHALAEVGAAICFPRHRVKFWHPRHPRKESIPLQGQAAMYLGEDVGAFRREFLQFGFVVTF